MKFSVRVEIDTLKECLGKIRYRRSECQASAVDLGLNRARIHGPATGGIDPRRLGDRDDRTYARGQETDGGYARADHGGRAARTGDGMTDFLRPNAYHEAGHAIVAWALDVPVQEIAICDDRPGGHTKTVAGGDDQLPLSGLVVLLNAGRQAEAIFGHLRPSWASDGDRMDTVKLLADKDVSDTAEIERWIESGCEHARYILRRHAHQVDRLAAQLIECRRMSADQFECFMRGYDADHLNDGKNWIRIYGPKSDGSYWLELRQADGRSFVFSVPASESYVLKNFQRLMPDGLVVPDVGDDGTLPWPRF